MTSTPHIPVLLNEALQALNLAQSKLVVDATYGRGGHAQAIFRQLSPNAQLIVIDRDSAAIEQARATWGSERRVEAVHAPFSRLSEIIGGRNLVGKVDGILFDLGVSSPQLDQAERGFGFSRDGPLDMRMDQTRGITAQAWIRHVDEKELARVLRVYGEERFARRISRTIKKALEEKEIRSTGELTRLISAAVPTREKGKHPATRSFQAIRIAVNDELQEIDAVLPQALEVLSQGGRMVFISFHSLEDRIVKRYFKTQSRGDPYPRDLPVTHDMLKPRLRLIGKAVMPCAQEVARNPRARSAVMRVAQKVSP